MYQKIAYRKDEILVGIDAFFLICYLYKKYYLYTTNNNTTNNEQNRISKNVRIRS